MQQPKRTLKRIPDRAVTDPEWVRDVVGSAKVAHVGFIDDGMPYVIPMAVALFDGRAVIHGSKASRIANTLLNGQTSCLAITHLDGLVLADSVFDHSMNYRSLTIWDEATKLEGEDKLAALQAITDQLAPGQWEYARQPSREELAQTSVLAYRLDRVSGKCRQGAPGPSTDPKAWTGEIRLETRGSEVVPAEGSLDREVPAHIRGMVDQDKDGGEREI